MSTLTHTRRVAKQKHAAKALGDAPLHHPEQHVGYKCKVGGAEVLDRDAPRVAQRAHDLRKVWPNDKDQHPSPQPVPQWYPDISTTGGGHVCVSGYAYLGAL